MSGPTAETLEERVADVLGVLRAVRDNIVGGYDEPRVPGTVLCDFVRAEVERERERAAAVADKEHDENVRAALLAHELATKATMPMARGASRQAALLCEERALVAARIADEIRALVADLRTDAPAKGR